MTERLEAIIKETAACAKMETKLPSPDQFLRSTTNNNRQKEAPPLQRQRHTFQREQAAQREQVPTQAQRKLFTRK